MHPRIQEVLSALDEGFAALRAAVDTVPHGVRQRRPAPDRWSVAEVLEHVAVVDASILKACARRLAAARAAGLPEETDTSSVLPMLPIARVAARDRRIAAPASVQPKGNDANTAWASVLQARAALIEFVRTCDGLALGGVSFAHPALGSLNLYQWLLFAAGHHARHAAQIREIAGHVRSADVQGSTCG